MDWAYLFEIALTGLAGGGLYALAALAFVLVYKATRVVNIAIGEMLMICLLYTSPSPRDLSTSRMPSSA